MILAENNGAKRRLLKLFSKSKDKVNKMKKKIQLHVYHSENNLHFDETLVMFVLFQTNTYTFKWILYSANSVSSVRGYTWHSTLSCFRANQTFLLLIVSQKIPISVFDLTRPGLEPTIYTVGGDHINHSTPMWSGIYLTDCKRYLIDVMIRENTTCRMLLHVRLV